MVFQYFILKHYIETWNTRFSYGQINPKRALEFFFSLPQSVLVGITKIWITFTFLECSLPGTGFLTLWVLLLFQLEAPALKAVFILFLKRRHWNSRYTLFFFIGLILFSFGVLILLFPEPIFSFLDGFWQKAVLFFKPLFHALQDINNNNEI